MKVTGIPTEQDILRALNAWQPHPQTTPQESACLPGACFCCDAARELSVNTPFMVAMQSVAEQLQAGEAHQLDALMSVFALGILTAKLMKQGVQ
jgi:hypothetical protein